MSIVLEPEFLLPKKGVELEKWAVIACDQFTSQKEYWEELGNYVRADYSTLNLIFPEVYLSSDNSKRISAINDTMREDVEKDIFDEYKGYVLVERTLRSGEKRLGLMILVDLEAYEYSPNSKAEIRATEKTVVERLPIRIDIRRNATLELPHIMLLMNDRKKSIIEELYKRRDYFPKLYDTDLNMDGGHLTGYFIQDETLSDRIESLAEDGLLFAVGDGNHSLATAKECWEEKKRSGEGHNLLARYAMCELVNLYDESLVFEPIHRTVKGVGEEFIEAMQSELSGEGGIIAIFNGKEYNVSVPLNPSDAIKDIQDFIDRRVEGKDVDYIHGEEHLRSVSEKEGSLGILMPTIQKEGLFDYVARRGVLPRKSFSMGEAEDKRYYLEVRKIW